MQTKLIGLGVIVFLAVCLFWQAERRGADKAEIATLQDGIATVAQSHNELLARQQADHQLLAESRQRNTEINHEADELRGHLNSIPGCTSTAIDAATVERVCAARGDNKTCP